MGGGGWVHLVKICFFFYFMGAERMRLVQNQLINPSSNQPLVFVCFCFLFFVFCFLFFFCFVFVLFCFLV